MCKFTRFCYPCCDFSNVAIDPDDRYAICPARRGLGGYCEPRIANIRGLTENCVLCSLHNRNWAAFNRNRRTASAANDSEAGRRHYEVQRRVIHHARELARDYDLEYVLRDGEWIYIDNVSGEILHAYTDFDHETRWQRFVINGETRFIESTSTDVGNSTDDVNSFLPRNARTGVAGVSDLSAAMALPDFSSITIPDSAYQPKPSTTDDANADAGANNDASSSSRVDKTDEPST